MSQQNGSWMEFRQIRYALAVANERSFTMAATRLNISQSAVSEQIKLLEAKIGFELFRRTGHGVEQTERGRMFIQEAERVFSDFMKLGDVARRLSGVELESLSIGLSSGLASSIVPSLFRQNAFPPNLHLEIRTAPTRVVFDALHDDKLDIGIVVDVGPDRIPSGLINIPLLELDLMLALPPSHSLTTRDDAIDIDRLADEPIIMNELSIGYGQIVSRMFTDLGIQPQIKAIVDNVETIKAMVQSGAGVAIIPSAAATAEAKLGLIELRPLTRPKKVTISAYHSRQALSRRKRTLINWLLKSAKA